MIGNAHLLLCSRYAHDQASHSTLVEGCIVSVHLALGEDGFFFKLAVIAISLDEEERKKEQTK